MKKWIFCLAVLLSGCSMDIPEQVHPVTGFELKPYLGSWYEIARLDHSFERGLDHVTAEYSLLPDGGVKVVNRGYDREKKEWDDAKGKAYFVETPDVAHLKVSFFRPFYASYIVFYLDKNYENALISGPDHSYFWILSRHKKLDQKTLDNLLLKAKGAGFDTAKLIYVDQS